MYDSYGEAEFRKRLGRQLARVRNSKGVSQSELKRRANISIGFISRVERGEAIPSILTLRKWVGKGLKAGLEEVFAGLK